MEYTEPTRSDTILKLREREREVLKRERMGMNNTLLDLLLITDSVFIH